MSSKILTSITGYTLLEIKSNLDRPNLNPNGLIKNSNCQKNFNITLIHQSVPSENTNKTFWSSSPHKYRFPNLKERPNNSNPD